MSDLERLREAIDDVDEIYSYIKGDYFDEKWGLGEKAERVKGLLRSYRDLLANGEVTAWCTTHHSVYLNPDDGCEAIVGYQAKRREPCVETWVRIHPTTEEKRPWHTNYNTGERCYCALGGDPFDPTTEEG